VVYCFEQVACCGGKVVYRIEQEACCGEQAICFTEQDAYRDSQVVYRNVLVACCIDKSACCCEKYIKRKLTLLFGLRQFVVFSREQAPLSNAKFGKLWDNKYVVYRRMGRD
jgi:hypothetical protein